MSARNSASSSDAAVWPSWPDLRHTAHWLQPSRSTPNLPASASTCSAMNAMRWSGCTAPIEVSDKKRMGGSAVVLTDPIGVSIANERGTSKSESNRPRLAGAAGQERRRMSPRLYRAQPAPTDISPVRYTRGPLRLVDHTFVRIRSSETWPMSAAARHCTQNPDLGLPVSVVLHRQCYKMERVRVLIRVPLHNRHMAGRQPC